jgi:poly(beta-D-mannuronate) lyase
LWNQVKKWKNVAFDEHQPMRTRFFASFLSLSFGAFCALDAAVVRVGDPEAARKALRDAAPGDVIELAAGDWVDADLRLAGEGTVESPILIRAQEAGKTRFTGASRLRIGGRHLVVSGLHFHNISGSGADWLELRIDSKLLASHCRVTECVFSEDDAFSAMEKENRWIGLYGHHNELDHCSISGKKNQGATLVVWLGTDDAGHHRVHHNYFGPRPQLGKNGGETIRVGDSATHRHAAHCVIEQNVFFQCDGETECISNKSCFNLYHANWFHQVQGTLTLRHGNDCVVSNNFFAGDKVRRTCGIRVLGERHQILGNVLEKLEGDRFRAALCLVNGIPDSPDNGYYQVKDCAIQDNVIIDCKEGLVIGYNDEQKASLAPQDTRFIGNTLVPRKGGVGVDRVAEGAGMEYRDNQFEASQAAADAAPEVPKLEEVGAGWWRR